MSRNSWASIGNFGSPEPAPIWGKGAALAGACVNDY